MSAKETDKNIEKKAKSVKPAEKPENSTVPDNEFESGNIRFAKEDRLINEIRFREKNTEIPKELESRMILCEGLRLMCAKYENLMVINKEDAERFTLYQNMYDDNMNKIKKIIDDHYEIC